MLRKRERQNERRKESDRGMHTFDVFPTETDRVREGMNKRGSDGSLN